MKVYSWNIFFRNTDFDRAFDFIEHLDFDILCLQEVPESFLERLSRLDVHIASAPDVDRLFAHGTEHNFLVILSRHSIVAKSAFAFTTLKMPLRTRLFVRAMRRAHWSRVENRHGFFADIVVEGRAKPIRVFCLHLILAHPAARRQELDIAMREIDPSLPTIVCGDFNILDTPLVAPFNWLLGGRLSDALRWRRERREIESRFAASGFVNPLRGRHTHIFGAQLDHILVSSEFSVVRANVEHRWIGSDHYPVFVELEQTVANVV